MLGLVSWPHDSVSEDVACPLRCVWGTALLGYFTISQARVYNPMSSHVAGWSSPVARRAHNPKVAGSNPAPATKPSGAPVRAPFLFSDAPYRPDASPRGSIAVSCDSGASLGATSIGLVGVALAFGLTVVTMAYAVGHISGGQLQPRRDDRPVGRRPLPGGQDRRLHRRSGPGRHRRVGRAVRDRQRQGGVHALRRLRRQRLRRSFPAGYTMLARTSLSTNALLLCSAGSWSEAVSTAREEASCRC